MPPPGRPGLLPAQAPLRTARESFPLIRLKPFKGQLLSWLGDQIVVIQSPSRYPREAAFPCRVEGAPINGRAVVAICIPSCWQFFMLSRNEAPVGRGLTFVPGNVKTRIRPHYETAFASSDISNLHPHGLASRFAFPRKRGRDTGFPRSVSEVRGVRCLLSTGESVGHEAAPLKPTSHSHRACQSLWLFGLTIFITDSRMFTVPAAWPLPAL